MATCSSGGADSPPPSAECQDAMASFDKVYNKKGTVQVFPDFVEPRVNFFKKVIAGKVKGPQGSKQPGTPGNPTGTPGGKYDHTPTGSQQPGRQEEAGVKKKERGVKEPKSYVLDEKKIKDPNVISQLKAEECEFLVVQQVKAALEKITKPDDPPVFLLHNQDLAVKSKTNTSTETFKTGKLKGTSKTRNPQGTSRPDKSKDAAKPDKPRDPVIPDSPPKTSTTDTKETTTGKSQKGEKPDKPQKTGKPGMSKEKDKTDKSHETASSSKSEGEKDVLVLHPSLGVLILEVKGTERTDMYTRFNKATTQLSHARTSIQEEMGDLLEENAIFLTIALPKLKPEDANVIRKDAEERKRKKQASEAAEGTRSTEEEALVTSATGTAEHAALASPVCDSRPEKELLEDHQEILLLCGSAHEQFSKWVEHLMRLRASAGQAFKGSKVQERLENFKRACIRRLSVAAVTPGKSVKDSAALHRRFLLAAEQLRLRDSPDKLLYIRGPPGSGKTLLLAERARRWIREGRRVALAVGDNWYTPLLHQLTRSVCGDKTDGARVSTHNSNRDLLRWLEEASTADPVFVILDEARGVDYSSLLPHITAGRVGGLWAAYTADLSDEDKKAWQAAGGTTEQLQLCLRCPPSVMALSNSVRRERDGPPLLPPPVPVTRELGERVEVISHADHGQSQSYEECPTCREGVKNFFSSLGLLGDDVTSTLSLSDCVIITTHYGTDRERVARWLGDLGLRAVAEDTTDRYTPVLLPGQTPESRDQPRKAAWRARVVSGTDTEGRPVLHVVDHVAFLGLERAVVVVWHQDWEDENRQRQGQRDRNGRMYYHRWLWFRAATRCQGRLLLVAATPSPALSLLPASSPARGRSNRLRPRCRLM